ncbi:hypothetical protein N7462_001283 [Penicillium macrosclerotiorum]|uniref:uncharacterized protein n=1 Tax=Penicillium macrosclerotiorum TaxID=303699 RepID=UPI00254917D0|nr:uncharacterized protein N7462_001283 [Penicillium macrosclerotiorum]KAJ5691860.1 hypothetical protein N7462_001283 [Penicillium macrosclerotiorum]
MISFGLKALATALLSVNLLTPVAGCAEACVKITGDIKYKSVDGAYGTMKVVDTGNTVCSGNIEKGSKYLGPSKENVYADGEVVNRYVCEHKGTTLHYDWTDNRGSGDYIVYDSDAKMNNHTLPVNYCNDGGNCYAWNVTVVCTTESTLLQ